jgi:uncharacterized protein (TIGR03067 family)
MRRHLMVVAMCGLLLDTGYAQEKNQMEDQERIQGTWELQSGERKDKPFPEELIKQVQLTFSGNELTTKVGDRRTKAIFKLDPTKQPKEIDLDMEGHIGNGIYHLSKDSLKIAHGEVGDARPSDFPKAGSGLTVLVLKRKTQ